MGEGKECCQADALLGNFLIWMVPLRAIKKKKTFATVPKMLLCKTLNPAYLIIPTAK